MERAEFVVVGGGVYGAAVTYELAARGSAVTLLEADSLACRASDGPGKRGVRANLRSSHELPLVRSALAMWPGLSGRLGGPTGFERIGGLTLVPAMPDFGEIGLARAAAHQRLQRRHGIVTDLLDRAELESLEADVGDSEIAALYCADEGVADQRATTMAYADAALRLGATIHQAHPVHLIETIPTPLVVLTDGSRIEASRALVLTANFGTNAILDRSRLPLLPMWTMCPQVLLMRTADGYQPGHLIGHLQQTLAVKPLSGGVTMVSGGLRGKWDGASATGAPVDVAIAQSRQIAASVLPRLRDATLVTADAHSPETYTPDGLPYIDYLDSEQRVLVAAGWHGHGFAIAPAVADNIAEWLHTGRRPEPLSHFGIPRT